MTRTTTETASQRQFLSKSCQTWPNHSVPRNVSTKTNLPPPRDSDHSLSCAVECGYGAGVNREIRNPSCLESPLPLLYQGGM
eukprot:6201117-Pleurochrysis_carterae.AAC.2